MRGGEKVIDALCRLLPDADIFTLFYDPERMPESIRSHRVRASQLQPWRKHYRALLPSMPMALESFDLRGYDLIICSESGPAKGIIGRRTRGMFVIATRRCDICGTCIRPIETIYALAAQANADGSARQLPSLVGLRLGRTGRRICG